MEGYPIGLAVGLGAGIVIGISIGKKQKPWSEMTVAEKRAKIVLLAAGTIMFLAGLALFLTLAL